MKIQLAIARAARRIEQHDLELADGATLADALHAVDALGLDLAGLAVGVWGRAREPGWRLQDGDRLEWCRPLEVDPMEARRLRHAHQQRSKAAGEGDGRSTRARRRAAP